MFTSKAALLVGGWLALTATLAGTSGIAGETASGLLLALGGTLALGLTRGPRESR